MSPVSSKSGCLPGLPRSCTEERRLEGLELERRDERMKEWRDGHNDEEEERRVEIKREAGGSQAGKLRRVGDEGKRAGGGKKKMKGTR